MNTDQPKLFGLLPRYISWVTIVLALLTLGTFFAIASPERGYPMPMSRGGWAESESTVGAVPPTALGAPMMDASVSNGSAAGMPMQDIYYYPYPYQNPEVPASDTREFLKTYYSASMLTRDISGLVRTVEATVRGHGGRIDQMSASLKYGSIGFAMPKEKFEAFRAEVEGLVGERFLEVNVSSQNLLPQQVSLEEQQKRAAEIGAVKWEQALKAQEKKLTENAATVSGTVSLQWVSLWGSALLYLPGYWIPAIFALLTLTSFARDRRRVPSLA